MNDERSPGRQYETPDDLERLSSDCLMALRVGDHIWDASSGALDRSDQQDGTVQSRVRVTRPTGRCGPGPRQPATPTGGSPDRVEQMEPLARRTWAPGS